MWWASLALATEIPVFDAAQPVVVEPPDYAFPVGRVESAVDAAEYPTYVVVFERVDEDPETVVDRTWQEWSLDTNFEPKESILIVLAMEEREIRVRMGSRWDSELGLHNDALLPIIDEHFMPLAVAQDYEGGLAALVEGSQEAVRNGLWWREYGLSVGLGVFGAAGTAVVSVGGIGFLVVRRRQRGAAKQDFLAVRDAWRGKLAAAEQRLTDLLLNVELRDQIVALRIKGEHTQALLAEVLDELDEVRLGVVALQERLAAVEQRAESQGTAAAWKEAVVAVSSEFEFDTGKIQQGLFSPLTEKVVLHPQKFMESLEEGWKMASEGWERLSDAVQASLRETRQDVSEAEWQEARSKLQVAGLPETWLKEHPLYGGVDLAWDRLEALRLQDPVAYLDALEDSLKEANEAEARADWLVAQPRGEALLALAQRPEGIGAAVFTAEEDPEVALRAVHQQLTLLEEAFQRGEMESLVTAQRGAEEAIHALKQRWERAKEAVEQASPSLTAQRT